MCFYAYNILAGERIDNRSREVGSFDLYKLAGSRNVPKREEHDGY
jgi:hypothetical protein